ncbi:uncharacterized protein A4U43_C04F26120 [Asparagus officinalis]|uniref:Uncharacterized protein n=1 Tax=Asparagus officinalis TaxID=4686 RepID=A0A5P1F5H7_ASPOF|nr:uncharacterized protein A4U43_C04F26120 [Asparagus officinalis]
MVRRRAGGAVGGESRPELDGRSVGTSKERRRKRRGGGGMRSAGGALSVTVMRGKELRVWRSGRLSEGAEDEVISAASGAVTRGGRSGDKWEPGAGLASGAFVCEAER